MADVPESLKEFIARDLIYVIGGGTVLAAFLYRFGRLPSADVPAAMQILVAGIAYVIGYALQDFFSVIRLVTTAPLRRPSRLLQHFYARFTGETWSDLDAVDWFRLPSARRNALRDARERAEYQRVITLMMVGSTMAPSALMVGTLLAWKWLFPSGPRVVFDLALAIGSVVAALLFVMLCWLKAAELAALEAQMIRDYDGSGRA